MDTTSVTTSPLVAIVGPTASGKSALALALAQQYSGEIICADSRTIYKGMDIGTAKPSQADQKLVPHHLLDVLTPGQRYSVADFQRQAQAVIDDITSRGRLPIIVGGSGLYIDSILFGYRFDLGQKQSMILRPHTLVLGLKVARHEIKARSLLRLEAMLQAGLLDEVQQLLVQYPGTLPGLYYPILARHLAGELTFDEARELCVQADVNLAKRQMTWFRRNLHIHWLDRPEQSDRLLDEFLAKSLIQ